MQALIDAGGTVGLALATEHDQTNVELTNGMTALHCAATYGHAAVAGLLLQVASR